MIGNAERYAVPAEAGVTEGPGVEADLVAVAGLATRAPAFEAKGGGSSDAAREQQIRDAARQAEAARREAERVRESARQAAERFAADQAARDAGQPY